MNPGRILPAGCHGFADLQIGDRIETGSAEITSALIDAFAEISGDRFEIHLSEAAAARHGFAGRVAHGLLVLSVVDGLKNATSAKLQARASLGWDWRFRAPVLAGDTVAASITVAEKRSTRNADQGIVRLDFEVRNQRGDLVQAGANRLMVYA